jgi:hypothetical protein
MPSMKIANIKNMRDFFGDYMRHDGDWGVPELAKLQRLFRASIGAFHMRHVNSALEEANKIMHGHGTESIQGFTDSREMKDIALYVNMGNTYAATIIYDCISDKFYVGTYGDWLEWREGNDNYGLDKSA